MPLSIKNPEKVSKKSSKKSTRGDRTTKRSGKESIKTKPKVSTSSIRKATSVVGSSHKRVGLEIESPVVKPKVPTFSEMLAPAVKKPSVESNVKETVNASKSTVSAIVNTSSAGISSEAISGTKKVDNLEKYLALVERLESAGSQAEVEEYESAVNEAMQSLTAKDLRSALSLSLKSKAPRNEVVPEPVETDPVMENKKREKPVDETSDSESSSSDSGSEGSDGSSDDSSSDSDSVGVTTSCSEDSSSDSSSDYESDSSSDERGYCSRRKTKRSKGKRKSKRSHKRNHSGRKKSSRKYRKKSKKKKSSIKRGNKDERKALRNAIAHCKPLRPSKMKPSELDAALIGMGEKASLMDVRKVDLIKLLRARCADERVALGYLRKIERDRDLDSWKQQRKAFVRYYDPLDLVSSDRRNKHHHISKRGDESLMEFAERLFDGWRSVKERYRYSASIVRKFNEDLLMQMKEEDALAIRLSMSSSRKTVDTYRPKLMLADVRSLTLSRGENYGKKKIVRGSGASSSNASSSANSDGTRRTFSKECYWCGIKGHSERNCRKKARGDLKVEKDKKNSSDGDRTKTDPKGFCYNCWKKDGHMANECKNEKAEKPSWLAAVALDANKRPIEIGESPLQEGEVLVREDQWHSGIVNGKTVKVLVDTGALDASYISKKMVDELGLEIAKAKAQVLTCGTASKPLGTVKLDGIKIGLNSGSMKLYVLDQLIKDAGIILGGNDRFDFGFHLTQHQAVVEKLVFHKADDQPVLSSEEIPDLNPDTEWPDIFEQLKVLINDDPNDCVTEQEIRELVKDIESLSYDPVNKGFMKVAPLEIELKPGMQPKSRFYSIKDRKKREVLDEDEREKLAAGLYVRAPPGCPYNHPLMVAERNGKFRPCDDLQALNDVTVPVSYRMPKEEEINMWLRETKFISLLDDAKGFSQIPVAAESQPLLAFDSVSHGKLMPTIMVFGAKNAVAKYQSEKDFTTEGIEQAKTFVDDVAVKGDSNRDHYLGLRAVISRYMENNTQLRISKCIFAQKAAVYLSREVGSFGSRMPTCKVQAFVEMEPPKDANSVSRLGQCLNYWHRYIPNLAVILEPLTRLTKKGVPWKWEAEEQAAWGLLKETLLDRKYLIGIDPEKVLVLFTDASDIGMGGVLCQERDGILLPIAFISCRFNSAQLRYGVTDKEALGIVWSCNKLTGAISMTKTKLIVMTDHKPLLALFKKPIVEVTVRDRRIFRYQVIMRNYEWELHYIEGEKNKMTDYMSREALPVKECVSPDSELHLMALNLLDEEELDSIESLMPEVGDSILTPSLVKPELKELYDAVKRTHVNNFHKVGKKLVKLCGTLATPTELGRVAQMVRNDCVTCERCANFNHQHTVPRNPSGTELEPWDRFHSDSLSLPTTSENNGNITVAVDNGTKTVFLERQKTMGT
eukprot:Awhi_evm1s1521